MANTYILINSTTLGSNTTSDTSFTSIPNTYTDLVLLCSIRKTGGSTGYIRFNSDSATNYSDTYVGNDNGAASSGRDSNSNYGIVLLGDNSYTASTFGNLEIYISNYTSTSSKPFYSYGVAENNSASVNKLFVYANLYRGTSAISSITFHTLGDTYQSGSSFYLYGIKNS